MITVNKIIPQVVEHFDPSGKSLGLLNEYESTDLRCQIAESNVNGYYLMFNNQKIEILPNGKIDNWVSGLYDLNENLIAKLFKSQQLI